MASSISHFMNKKKAGFSVSLRVMRVTLNHWEWHSSQWCHL